MEEDAADGGWNLNMVTCMLRATKGACVPQPLPGRIVGETERERKAGKMSRQTAIEHS